LGSSGGGGGGDAGSTATDTSLFDNNLSFADDTVQKALDTLDETAGGTGAPTTANYLTGSAQPGLSAEIVVGTTPGGELGGSWASPTVDATHSGSSHAATQAAAEATAAGALSSHEADTTAIHGIADTSVLETTTGAQAKVDTHVNDTDDAHDASAISTVTTAFGNHLSANEDTVQKALDVLDDIVAGGASALNDLTDVDTTGVATADTIIYNGASWVDGLNDTTISVAANDTPAALKAVSDYVCDGTADEAQINAAIAAVGAGGVVQLLPGIYSTDATVDLADGVTLTGTHGSRWPYSLAGDALNPCVIKGSAGTFTGTAVVKIAEGVMRARIAHLTIDGGLMDAGTVYGLHVQGDARDWQVEDVAVTAARNTGVRINIDGGASAPRGGRLSRVTSSQNVNHGFSIQATDSIFTDCLAVSNTGGTTSGFIVNPSGESQFIGCRSVFNARHGFSVEGAWNINGGATFVGCSTDRNDYSGFRVNATTAATRKQPIVFAGCVARRDAADAGLHAGFEIRGGSGTEALPVELSGCITMVGQDDGATGKFGPDYGLWIEFTSEIRYAGLFQGEVADVQNDGGPHLIEPARYIATGEVNPTPGEYGDANNSAVVTVDGEGRVTTISETAIAGGGGAPTSVDYLVGTADPTLTNEIVVGTTPGGQLGGTWVSPTVDDNHATGTHASFQAAAEATAAGALSSHEADTTAIHGIADTSVLETTSGAQTKVDTHVNNAVDAHDASAISVADADDDLVATQVEAAILELRRQAGRIVTDAATNRNLILTDAGKVIEMTNASANTVTIPQNATVAFPIGTLIGVAQKGNGTTTVTTSGSATIDQGPLALAAQHSEVLLRKRTTDAWTVIGDVAPAALAGDVTGAPTANTVGKIQGRNVSNTAPAAGQGLVWNAATSAWEPLGVDAYHYHDVGAAAFSNTTTETTVFASTPTAFAANSLRVGDCIEIFCAGEYLQNSGSNKQLSLRVKLGGQTVTLLSGINYATNALTRWYKLEWRIIVISIGASAALHWHLDSNVAAPAITADDTIRQGIGAVRTVDTTAALTPDVTLQMSTADATQTITPFANYIGKKAR